MALRLTRGDVAAFERCIAGGGVAVFPTDTLYGLGCDPQLRTAIERMYCLKGRVPGKPSALMFFGLGQALAALPGLGPATAGALRALLPGPLAVVVPGRAGRFPHAEGSLGLGVRVPRLDGPLAALAGAEVTVLQTSANVAGGTDPRCLGDVPEPIRAGADLVLDGGKLPGSASTVVDLTRFESRGEWEILREGAVPGERVAMLLERAP